MKIIAMLAALVLFSACEQGIGLDINIPLGPGAKLKLSDDGTGGTNIRLGLDG